MKSRYRMMTVLVFFTILGGCLCCDVEDVGVYKVQLKMMWEEDNFRHYVASGRMEWSQVFGQSHNKTYALYRLGEIARPAVRNFAQTGNMEDLMAEGDEETRVYDQFTAPGVEMGKGETEGLVFVDGEHSLVSLICRMMGTPDWFIGVDSLDLCVDSSWIEEVTLDLEPLDAGITSNNDIPETVDKVSHRNLDYPGSSFYHRKIRQTPSIAQVEFIKVKQYSTKELNDLARKEIVNAKRPKTVKNVYKENNKAFAVDDFITKSPLDKLKDLEEDPVGTPRPNLPDNNVLVVTQRPVFESPDDPEDLKNMDDVVLAVATGHKLGLGKHLPRHFKSRLHHAVNHHIKRNKDKDCVVSEWSEWTTCTEPCNGETVRMRSILEKNRGNGKECPPLFEKKNCKERCRGDGDYLW